VVPTAGVAPALPTVAQADAGSPVAGDVEPGSFPGGVPYEGNLPPFTRHAPVEPRPPPGTLPAPVAPFPEAPPPQPFGTIAAPRDAGPARPPGTDWDQLSWPKADAYTGTTSRRRASGPRRAHFDVRAAFVTGFSLVVLGASMLPWYQIRVIGPGDVGGALNKGFTYLLYSSTYGGWRVLVPVVAAITVILGLVNMFFRSGDRGAVALFMALRVAALVELGLVIATLVTRTPPHSLSIPVSTAVETVVELTVWAWIGLIAAIVAAFSSLSSSGRTVDSTGR